MGGTFNRQGSSCGRWWWHWWDWGLHWITCGKGERYGELREDTSTTTRWSSCCCYRIITVSRAEIDKKSIITKCGIATPPPIDITKWHLYKVIAWFNPTFFGRVQPRFSIVRREDSSWALMTFFYLSLGQTVALYT